MLSFLRSAETGQSIAGPLDGRVITRDKVNVEIDSVIYFLVRILFYFFIHYI